MSSMMNSFYKWLEPGLIALVVSLMIGLQVLAAVPSETEDTLCAETYVFQADDHLPRLAERYYGDAALYPLIISATNQKHVVDSAFPTLSEPNTLRVGDKLCIAAP